MNPPSAETFTLHKCHRDTRYLDQKTPDLTFGQALDEAHRLAWDYDWKIARDSDGKVLVLYESDGMNAYLWAELRRAQLAVQS